MSTSCRTRKPRPGWTVPLAALLLVFTRAWAADFPVRVHGAVPDDGKDDSAGVQAALDAAKAAGGGTVLLEAGTYDFSCLAGWTLAEDERDERITAYLTLADAHDVTIAGTIAADGAPATLLLKHNDLRWGQPRLLHVQGGSRFILRDIAVDVSPYYFSTAIVTDIQGELVSARVLPGHPRIDGQVPGIMGLYDLAARRTLISRLVWGQAKAHDAAPAAQPSWRATGGPAADTMEIRLAPLATTAKRGQAVFWFQGNFEGNVIALPSIDGLLVENVHLRGGHGFPLVCNYSKDVTYRDVRLEPPAGRIVTTCRDGLKLNGLRGTVLMERVRIDGCAGDDGQNIHSTWLSTVERSDARTLVAESGTPRQALLPEPGERVSLLDADFAEMWRGVVVAAVHAGKNTRLTVDRDLPTQLAPGLAVELTDRFPSRVHFKDCVFRNTGRYGIVGKASDLLIEGCTFEHNIGGIMLGGKWVWGKWLEASTPQRVEIRGCTFRTNDQVMYGHRKLQEIGGRGIFIDTNAGVVRDLRIHGNRFIGESTAILLERCHRAWVWDNDFTDCGKTLVVDAKTTADIHQQAPKP